MATTLTSTSHGVDLANYLSGNPFTIAAGTSIQASSGIGVYGPSSNSWVLSSAGLISGGANSGGNGGYGVEIIVGAFTNTGTVLGGASPPAVGGVGAFLAAGQIVNGGSIAGGAGNDGGGGVVAGCPVTNQAAGHIVGGAGGTGTGSGGYGVFLLSSGNLTNGGSIGGGAGGSSGTKAAGGIGVFGHGGGVINTGQIAGGAAGRNPSGYGLSGGVGLKLSGGQASNSATGTIVGGAGIYGSFQAGAGGLGSDVYGGATLTNSGHITGGAGGGSGLVTGVASGGNGAQVQSVLTNLAGGVIGGGAGATNYNYSGSDGGNGVYATTGATITNAGTLQGGAGGGGRSGGAGVSATGTVNLINSGLVEGGAYGGNGYAGFAGVGAAFAGASVVTNIAGGTIVGASGGGGLHSAGVYIPSADALDMHGGGSVTNSGVIAGGGGDGEGGTGLSMSGAGLVTNAAGGVIRGGNSSKQGIGGDGVILANGASLANAGSIGGGGSATVGAYGGVGIYMSSAATLSNTGVVSGGAGGVSGLQGDGVSLSAGGAVFNIGTSASISGYIGVYAGAGGVATVTDSGTIIGSVAYALEFKNAADQLILGAGAYFIGQAQGGGGTIVFNQGSGSITGLGASANVTGAALVNCAGFNRYDITGGSWVIGPWKLGVSQVLENDGTTQLNGALTFDDGFLNKGLMTTNDGGTVGALQQIANYGTFTVASVKNRSELVVAGGGLLLESGGTVALSGPKAVITGATAASVLDNVDNTISGQGFIGLSSLTLENEAAGVIDSVGKQGLVINTKGATSTNAGIIEASSGSTLVVQNSTFTQAGGSIAALTGGRVDLEDDVIVGGTVSQAGTGVVNINTTGGELKNLTLTGVIQVVHGVSETLDGTILNSGKLDTFGAATAAVLVVGPDGLTLTGGGQVNTNPSTANTLTGSSGTVTLDNVDNRISGAGAIGNKSLILINEAKGAIVGDSKLTLTIDTGASSIANAGLIESAGAGSVIVNSALNNTGTLFAAAGTLTLDGAVTGAGVQQIKAGVLNIAAASGQSVQFLSPTSGQLKLTDYKDFTGTVKGLSTTGTNSLDIAGIAFVAGKTTATFSGTTTGGTLTITNGTLTATVSLTGNYAGHTFTAVSDGHGGLLVKDPTTPAAPLTQAIAAFGSGSPSHPTIATSWAPPRQTTALVRP